MTPDWYRAQPHSPHCVYSADTIKDIQRTLLVNETGVMDEATITHIKGLQSMSGMKPTGFICHATAVQIQRLRERYAVPVEGAEGLPLREQA